MLISSRLNKRATVHTIRICGVGFHPIYLPVSSTCTPCACEASRKQRSLSLRALMGRVCRCQAELRRLGHGVAHVIDSQAEVMHPGPMFREPGLYWMIGRERLDQLQVRVTHIQVRKANSAVIDLFSVEHRKTELIAPDLEGGFGVGDDNGDDDRGRAKGIENWELRI